MGPWIETDVDLDSLITKVRVNGTATSSKKTSQNSSTPCMVRIGRTVMPGVSISAKRAVIPRCADSGVPVRVSNTQRCAY